MKFICDKCSAKYSISDQKVRKKVLKIRCKKCSHVIIVRDPQSRAQRPDAGGQAAAQPQRQTAPQVGQAHTAKTAGSPFQQQQGSSYNGHSFVHNQGQSGGDLKLDLSEPQQQEERTVIARISTDWIRQMREEKQEEPIWFMAIHGQPTGPVVKSEVIRNIQQGQVKADTLIWCGGWPEWTAASHVAELKEAFQFQARMTPPPVGAPAHVQQLKETPREPIHTPNYNNNFGEPSSPLAAQAQNQTYASTPSVEQLHAVEPAVPESPHTLPSSLGASPLSLLQQPATSETIADPVRPEPMTAKPNGGSLGGAFGSTLAPSQPSLSEPQEPLARGPVAPQQSDFPSVFPPSQTAPAPHQQDVAHEAQAVPAVEFIESSAEADFFAKPSSEFMAAVDSKQDLVEVALPPIPIDEPEEEFDIDDADIIEIRETLKPKWSARLAVAAGLGVVAALLTLPMLLNNRDSNATSQQTLPTPRLTTNETKPAVRLSKKDEEARRRLLAQDNASPAVVPKPGVKEKKRRVVRRVRRRFRRTRITRVKKVPKKTKLGSIDDKINKLFMKKFGGGKTKKSAEPEVGAGIDKALAKRLYKELNNQNSKVQYCYNLHLKSGNYLAGILKLTLGVSPGGRVNSIKVSPRRFKGKRFTNCLIRTIRYKWRFTPFDGETVYLEAKYSLKASY